MKCAECLLEQQKSLGICLPHQIRRLTHEHPKEVIWVLIIIGGIALGGLVIHQLNPPPPPVDVPTYTLAELPALVMALQLPPGAWLLIFGFVWLTKW